MSLPLGGPVHSGAKNWQALPQTKLPNGLAIRYVSRRDVPFLYREVYEEQNYLSGLSLRRGDTVLDVGANIGLFGLRAAETVGREVRRHRACPELLMRLATRKQCMSSDHHLVSRFRNCMGWASLSAALKGRVVCMEPIPKAAAALEHNVQSHKDWCSERGEVLLGPSFPASLWPPFLIRSRLSSHPAILELLRLSASASSTAPGPTFVKRLIAGRMEAIAALATCPHQRADLSRRSSKPQTLVERARC